MGRSGHSPLACLIVGLAAVGQRHMLESMWGASLRLLPKPVHSICRCPHCLLPVQLGRAPTAECLMRCAAQPWLAGWLVSVCLRSCLCALGLPLRADLPLLTPHHTLRMNDVIIALLSSIWFL